MNKKCSASLNIFIDLVRKTTKQKKKANEIKDLLFWFVDNCPSENGPDNAKKFKDYGINGGSAFKTLKKSIITSVGLKKDSTYIWCESNKIEEQIENITKIFKKAKKIIYFTSGTSKKEMDSLFIRIRNSFAHGNYLKKMNIIFFGI